MAKKHMKPLRRLHGKIHDYHVAVRSSRELNKLVRKGRTLSVKALTEPREEVDFSVDFVVLWVDGNDLEWQKEKALYMPEDQGTTISNSSARFRDWDLFHFWFRSVEKYAPWVRNVYLVTWGHVPAFLNLDNPKLKFVKHSDFMPKEYLPTFSCFPTELNLWRIEGISEHIIYFNDDMFLTRPVKKSDFFYGELPKYCGVALPSYPHLHMTAWPHNLYNNAGVVNDLFDLKSTMQRYPEKWFAEQYGDWGRDLNRRAYEDQKIFGMFFSHLGVPYRCSTMKALWDAIPDRLDSTCKNKFRTMDDVFHQLFQMWEIYHGTFEPVSPTYFGKMEGISIDNIEKFKRAILTEHNMMVCPNDWEGISELDFEKLKLCLHTIFETKFPDKSSFER